MKRIALINDLSGFGKCSLGAAIPVISVMGMQACPLPTAVLSSQTEFESYYCHDLTDKMDMITDQWGKLGVRFDGIYSGYLASSKQIQHMLHFLDCFQEEGTLYLADPVMGDRGFTYDMFSREFLDRMKELTKRADVITPNLTEACLLTGVDYEELITHRQEPDYIERIREMCQELRSKAERKQTVVVTGVIREKQGVEYIGNIALSDEEFVHTENPYTGKGFSGTGDLFASVICGSLVKGLSVQEAMEKAVCFLQDAIEEASREDIPAVHGVYFEKYLSRLL
ncbi:MAG: pyridoxamine kinase [Lachnospira sp.]|nr:pyridoxamine kinase [Lachnospira sp.]